MNERRPVGGVIAVQYTSPIRGARLSPNPIYQTGGGYIDQRKHCTGNVALPSASAWTAVRVRWRPGSRRPARIRSSSQERLLRPRRAPHYCRSP